MDPKRSLELLEVLVKLGFTDEAFAKLHHYRLKDRNASISAHRNYCNKISYFQDLGENQQVQRRLELVLTAYQAAGFRSNNPSVFVALADAAFHELP